MSLICEIHRCSKKEGMYIYIDKSKGLESLSEALLKTTGRLELAMTLNLHPEKKLANAKAKDVIESINEKGFYLQMPPSLHGEALANTQAINEANHFLER